MDQVSAETGRTGHTAGSGYRADIESLRAFAILSVVVYHAAPALLPGGFIGVDVFFVLSGFLITQILYRELLATGRIGLVEFWARRARRILPAACLVLITTAVASLALMSPLDLKEAYQDIIAAAAYVINWRLASRAVDYLAQDEAASVVLHYWSLSVEEQFYIGWPLLAGLVAWWARRHPDRNVGAATLGVIAVLWLASFGLGLYLTSTAQPFAFFGTGARIWQLLSGAALAVAVSHAGPSLLPKAWSGPAGWIGLALILAAAVLLSRDTAYPGFAALMPVLGAALLIAANAPQHSLLARVLGLSSLRYIGRISYAWYLWHWPVLILGAMLLPREQSGLHFLLVAAAFVLAVATHHLVENPVRFAPALMRSPLRSVAMGAALTVLCIACAGGVGWIANQSRIRLQDGTTFTLAAVKRDLPRSYRDKCHVSFSDRVSPECAYGRPDGARVAFLLGDSHAAQWLPALERAAAGTDWRILSRTKSACPPIDTRLRDRRRNREYWECREWLANVLDEIRTLRPAAVFVTSYSYQNASSAAATEGQTLEDKSDRLASAERRILERIAASAGRTYVLRDTPSFKKDPSHCLLANPGREELCRWPLAKLGLDRSYPTADFSDLAPAVQSIDLTSRICPEGVCAASRDGMIMMRDTHHLTGTFASSLAPEFARLLSAAAERRN